MKSHFINKKNYMYFDGIQDMVDYLKNAPLVGDYPREDYSTENPSQATDSFYGGISYQDALYKLQNGDEKIAKEIKEIKDAKLETQRVLQRFTNDIHGFIPNVPNAIKGLPKSMINIHRNRISGNNKMIDLVLDADASAAVRASDYTKVAHTFLNLVDSLEKQGYRLNLYYAINTYFSSTKTKVCWLMKLKDACEPFNKYKCAFPLGTVAMFRRIGFRLIETLPSGAARQDAPHGGYGRPGDSRDNINMIQENLYILNGVQPKNLKIFDVTAYVDKSEDKIIDEVINGNNYALTEERKRQIRKEM